MEDDVDVWRYAILEVHARNDDDDDWVTCGLSVALTLSSHTQFLHINPLLRHGHTKTG